MAIFNNNPRGLLQKQLGAEARIVLAAVLETRKSFLYWYSMS
jgi:hypothetical protein